MTQVSGTLSAVIVPGKSATFATSHPLPHWMHVLRMPVADINDRLMEAVQHALAEDAVHLAAYRWHGWFVWQTGMDIPADLFGKLVSCASLMQYAQQYGTPDEVAQYKEEVDWCAGQITSIVVGRLGRKAA